MRPRRNPSLPDAALAAAVFATLLGCALSRGSTSPGELALTLLLAAPLAWRSVAPFSVLVVVTSVLFASLAWFDGTMFNLLSPAIALYTVAATYDTRVAIGVGVAIIPLGLLGVALYSEHALLRLETLKTLGILVLPLVCGRMMAEKTAKVQAIRERAERAEATREEEARRRVGEERLRIARDVHDVVAHAMVAINVQASVAAHVVDRRPEQALTALEEIKRVSGGALRDLRETLGVLREIEVPAPTEPARTLDAVGELAERMRAAGLDVAVQREGCERVPSAVASVAYRIVQESLTNVLRHAPDATRADVHLAVLDDALQVDVRDDGTGLGGGAEGTGNGLRGMRERAAAIGGRLDAGPTRARGGWVVRALLPLPAAVRE